MSQYDYLVVGAGWTGAVFAPEAPQIGKKCLVIDRRDHIAGNVFTEEIEGMNVHRYGAHIFHTSLRGVWDYMGQFCEFNNYVNSPVAFINGETYNMPFNMNTFSKLWGKAREGLHREAMGTRLQRFARQHHQTPAMPLHL